MIRPYTERDAMTHSSPPAPKAATVGLWLFLAALTMLFGASLLAYLIIRLGSAQRAPANAVQLPWELWISTAMVIGVSVSLWRALEMVQREKQAPFRRWLTAALLLGAGFIAVQTPALTQLLMNHQAQRARITTDHQVLSAGNAIYGLIFVLILLHGLHVVGGIVSLVSVSIRGYRGAYDHEHYLPVRHTAMYWHFLDVVWLVMFLTFWVTR
jgi:heme/copper-type cytochrome/quinol oxidase subunit 3